MINIIILIACTLCGFALGKYIERRVKHKGEFYNDLVRYLTLLKINVEGRKLELPDFNADFAKQCSSNFAEFMRTGKLKCSLNSLQKSNLNKFFDNLSCASSSELYKHIEYCVGVIGNDAKQIENEVAKASVYVKLGLLLGLMVGIVFM